MHLNELEERVAADGPFEWVGPERIDGLDPSAAKARNERKWFGRLEHEEEVEGPDEKITDYLWACLMQREILIDDEENVPPELDIDAVMVVSASIYLICELGSISAGVTLSYSSSRELVTEDNVRTCLDLVAAAYQDSSGFVRDILRDYILDMFQYGPQWHAEGGYFSEALTPEQNAFLRRVFEQGYLTIDQQDARLFVDGSKRW